MAVTRHEQKEVVDFHPPERRSGGVSHLFWIPGRGGRCPLKEQETSWKYIKEKRNQQTT